MIRWCFFLSFTGTGRQTFLVSKAKTSLKFFKEHCPSPLERLRREGPQIGHAASLMGALFYASLLDIWCKGQYAQRQFAEELLVLAQEKHAPFFAALGTMQLGAVLAIAGDVEAAIPMIDAGMSRYRSMNST